MVFLLGLFYGVFSTGSSPATATIVACSPGIAGNVTNVATTTSTTARATVVAITVTTIVATTITASYTSKPCTYRPIPSQQPIATKT